MHVRSAVVVTAIALLTVLSAPFPAAAQDNAGVRKGASFDPDQFVFGGHVETGPLLERLVFRPNAEIGIGDNLIVIGLNFEFAFKIDLDGEAWTPYIGAGPAANIIDRDRGRRDDDTSVEGGFNILVGAEHDGGLFAELKIGALDSPDLKVMIGYSF